MTTGTALTLWVCQDCLFTDANGKASDDPDYKPDCEPWSLIPGEDQPNVTMGLLWDEHADDCPNRTARDNVTECECEQDAFSWSPCAACGSTLGGYRHAYTWHAEEGLATRWANVPADDPELDPPSSPRF